ncbi:hypothetical protein MLD38_036256 [Melastoma candidum]|uniref:Uncharacterized protein n=1 Tax=Melastoma candidum TaxID=119954 RepID=A0ACB9LJ33_9MYRT|nr:hypothetical protein MLD38_036256 [Melastoma candidum]
MAVLAPKGSSNAQLPRSVSFLTVTMGGLAVFLMVGSFLLVSHPIGSKVRWYFYGVEEVRRPDEVMLTSNASGSVDSRERYVDSVQKDRRVSADSDPPPVVSEDKGAASGAKSASEGLSSKELQGSSSPSKVEENDGGESPVLSDSPEETASSSMADGLGSNPSLGEYSGKSSDDGCDLYQGTWVYDSLGPLYSNNSCPVLTQMQNCQGNGRPDKEYENWRWKPEKCDLPRFDGKKFLEMMRGKTIAYIGDSVARNQMESMLCILWQVEVPVNRGNKRMQRYYFRSTSVMIVRMWSSWLVHQTSEPTNIAPRDVVKLHLDLPDENIMEFLPKFDVVVLSSGHWFAKRSVYLLNNEVVGGQLWWPDKSRSMKVNNIKAFGISVETIVSAIVTHPNYTGITIVRSYSPDHYEGGAWNTGGSCTGKTEPLPPGKLIENGFTNVMHEEQVAGFHKGVKNANNKSKIRLMDITEAFGYRHDGHPGPYRNPDPNKITKRGPDGRPPPQDCLHWCMPGPVDTWNELVFEVLRREYEKK